MNRPLLERGDVVVVKRERVQEIDLRTGAPFDPRFVVEWVDTPIFQDEDTLVHGRWWDGEECAILRAMVDEEETERLKEEMCPM